MLRCVLCFTASVLDQDPAALPAATRGSLTRAPGVGGSQSWGQTRTVFLFHPDARPRARTVVYVPPLAPHVSVGDGNADGQ